MKRIVIIVAAASFMSGCAKEEISINGERMIEREFTAGFDATTKTSVGASGIVDWSSGDVINYYTASEGTVRNIIVPSDCHSVSFTATVGADDSFIIASYGGDISNPQAKSMTLSGVVNPEQSGKFEDAHVSVCKRYFENGNTLNFKNITSLIKFSLTRTDVSYVIFSSNDGTKLHGNGKLFLTFDGESISSAKFTDIGGGSSIRVNTDGSGTFYISTLPCEFTGFKIHYFNSSDKMLGGTVFTKQISLQTGSIIDFGVLDSRIEDIEPEDLSAGGTANCYIASKSHYPYKFRATVKGNTAESVGNPKKAKVLWESFGNDVTPDVGDVVSSASLDGEYIKFTAGQNGNAVIAVTDLDGDILWSWHIWVCDGYDAEAEAHVYNNSAGSMMDRNLGATSATPGDVRALGLLYQWGRKDPFLGSSSISYSTDTQAASTLFWPSSVTSDVSNGTITYSITHPTTFITNNDSNFDWYYTGSSSTDNTRWQTSDNTKGIYDPCPNGWRVPDGGYSGVWSTAFGSYKFYTGGPWDNTNNGMNFGLGNGKSTSTQLGTANEIWYPAAGHRRYTDNSLANVGDYGHYWSCTHYPYDTFAYNLYFYSSGESGVRPSYGDYRSFGLSVRCHKDEGSKPVEPVIDLSTGGPANSYIVSAKGIYKFKTVRGNTTASVGTVSSAEVLWESFGTDTAPSVGDLIKSDVSYSDDYITFSTNDIFKEGNAVIAAKDESGNILWSWHIWMTDAPVGQVYNNSAGTMMDRNLGATSATPGEVHALGLLYQWGRKDPFLGGCQISYSSSYPQEQAKSTGKWPSPTASTSVTGTFGYVEKHPMQFITYNKGNYDWYYGMDNTRWCPSKGIYDPCPSGWRVPDGGTGGVWSTAFGTSSSWKTVSNWDSTNMGMDFHTTDRTLGSGTIWYPAAGYLDGKNSLRFIGDEGYHWSCTPNDLYAFLFLFKSDGYIMPSVVLNCSNGHSVRCMKE